MNIIIIGLCLLLYATGFATAYIVCRVKYEKLFYQHTHVYEYCDQDCHVCVNKCEIYNLMGDQEREEILNEL